MKRLNVLAALLIAGTVSAAPKADLARGKQIAEQICAQCHGADGNSAAFPRLAAQHPLYIVTQTKAIKEGKRNNGAVAQMQAVPEVMSLSDDDIHHVAAYFAKQTAKSGESNPKANFELGKKIFRAGLADQKVPACMACHGPNGAGMPAGGTEVNAYPRIAGQDAAYIATQLKSYASGERTSPNGMMETIAKRMSEEDMKAVGNYIQGLR